MDLYSDCAQQYFIICCSREEQTLESLQSAGTKNYRLEEVPR